MEKITRIAYNSANWHHPTGDAAGQESGESYNNINGFGHEDWLFRDDWQIDGWHYAFLQGIQHSQPKLLREGKPFNVRLFTVQPDKQRRWVAYVKDVECLDDKQADEALDVFKENGWFAIMQREIRDVQGNVEALGNVRWAKHILNIRFRIQNVRRFPPDAFVSIGDPIYRQSRYVLVNDSQLSGKVNRLKGRHGSIDFPSITPFTRREVGPIQVSPEHARMQSILMHQLQAEYPSGRVVREEDFIDVLVETKDEVRLYEIKSDLAPRTAMRLAIGQLLEYSYPYFQDNKNGKKVTLIVVGRNKLTEIDATYLVHLRESFRLPLEYRVVSV